MAALGTDLGGRLWGLVGLLTAAAGLVLLTDGSDRWRWLPAFAGVPVADMLLNLQADGLVLLGLGGAWWLWRRHRPYLGGLALGLCLFKPHLVIPLGFALLAGRMWPMLAGWGTSLVVLAGSAAVRAPGVLVDWPRFAFGRAGQIGRELSLPGLTTRLPGLAKVDSVMLVITVLLLAVAVVWLAARRRNDTRAAAAILIAGGLLAAPHALGSDLVLLAAAAAVWAGTRWYDWLVLSAASVIAVINPHCWA